MPSPDDAGETEREEQRRPPLLALLFMTLFPFLLIAGIALLYRWLTG